MLRGTKIGKIAGEELMQKEENAGQGGTREGAEEEEKVCIGERVFLVVCIEERVILRIT